MDLLLKSLTWMEAGQSFTGDIRISGSVISARGKLTATKKEHVIDFKNHFLYPGLINAHDHLEMNLYPRLGAPPYSNYVEWGNDIYRPKESPILEIEAVNIKDRLLWGGIKNLISGVTTVVHHNPWNAFLERKEFPVKVLRKFAWSHSLAFGRNIQKEFPKNESTPYVIHAAEGIDELTHKEIQRIQELGLLKKNTVLIHGIALRDSDIELISDSNASLVWCPSSNLFMFNQTAPIDKIKGRFKIVLGSDSTLTGSPTLLDEMRVASGTGWVSPKEIFDMVTNIPAGIFNLPIPSLLEGSSADIFVTPILHENYFENLLRTRAENLAMVLVAGKPNLMDSQLDPQTAGKRHPVKIAGKQKWLSSDIAHLKKTIEKKTGTSLLQSNPLWAFVEAD